MFDRRLLQYFDWGLLALTVLIACLGLFVLYSAVTAETPVPQKFIFFKQLIWFSMALIAMVVSFSFNYKLLDRWGQAIYIACILFLIWVLFFGKIGGGSRRWLILGPISVQPSELAKIATMIVLAALLSTGAKIADSQDTATLGPGKRIQSPRIGPREDWATRIHIPRIDKGEGWDTRIQAQNVGDAQTGAISLFWGDPGHCLPLPNAPGPMGHLCHPILHQNVLNLYYLYITVS